MKRTSRTTGRLGLLATPLLTAVLALALSACGSNAPSGSRAANSSQASTGSPALSSSSASSAASTAAFCQIWRETRTTMSVMNAVTSGAGYSMSSPTSVLLPTMQALNNVFARATQVAPAAVSADMATLATWWNQVVADFKYGKTVGQVHAYLKAHPPAGTTTAAAAVHSLSNYLSTTCHINMSS